MSPNLSEPKLIGRPSRKAKNLSASRGPQFGKRPATLSSKNRRHLVRTHHHLLKAGSRAARQNDANLQKKVSTQIHELGGLATYQIASQNGQSARCGGDTSKVLKSWLRSNGVGTGVHEQDLVYLALEIGCVSADNAISRLKYLEVTRIDLHSTNKAITEQDFMHRPFPLPDGNGAFDLISLSLVLNYVQGPEERGDMLIRTTKFLRIRTAQNVDGGTVQAHIFPALFLCLPLPCVMNSRYLTVPHLTMIMASIGYTNICSRCSSKIYYSLWSFDPATVSGTKKTMKKREIAPGSKRNNFCIVIR